MKRKPNIVLFTRFFPPLISGCSRRSAHMVLGFRELGYRVTIVAPELPPLEIGMRILHPQPVPTSFSSQADWKAPLRSLLLWPDADINWSKRAYKATKEAGLIKPGDIVLTTSPPESVHFAGYHAKIDLDCVWIADFRDSWLLDPLSKQRSLAFRRAGEERIARKWLSKTDMVISPSTSILDEVTLLSKRDIPCLHIPQSAEAPPSNVLEENKQTFTLTHAGSFSLSDPLRDIKPLLELVNMVPTRISIVLELIGRLTNNERELAQRIMGERVRIKGIMSRESTLDAIGKADALVLVVAPERTAVPGKLAEYIMARKPLVILGEGPWQELAGLPIEMRKKPALDQLQDIITGNSGLSLLPLPPSPKEIATRIIHQIHNLK